MLVRWRRSPATDPPRARRRDPLARLRRCPPAPPAGPGRRTPSPHRTRPDAPAFQVARYGMLIRVVTVFAQHRFDVEERRVRRHPDPARPGPADLTRLLEHPASNGDGAPATRADGPTDPLYQAGVQSRASRPPGRQPACPRSQSHEVASLVAAASTPATLRDGFFAAACISKRMPFPLGRS